MDINFFENHQIELNLVDEINDNNLNGIINIYEAFYSGEGPIIYLSIFNEHYHYLFNDLNNKYFKYFNNLYNYYAFNKKILFLLKNVAN